MKSFTFYYASLTLDKKVSSTTPIVNKLHWWLDCKTFEAFKGKEKGDAMSIINNVHNQLLQKCQKGKGKEKKSI
jgi:predicted transposase YbfD/YdcC